MTNRIKIMAIAATLALLAGNAQAVSPDNQTSCGAAQLKALLSLVNGIDQEGARACATGDDTTASSVNGATLLKSTQTYATGNNTAILKFNAVNCILVSATMDNAAVVAFANGLTTPTAQALASSLCTP